MWRPWNDDKSMENSICSRSERGREKGVANE